MTIFLPKNFRISKHNGNRGIKFLHNIRAYMIDLRAISFPCNLNRFDFINDLNISNTAIFSRFLPFLGVNISKTIEDIKLKFSMCIKTIMFHYYSLTPLERTLLEWTPLRNGQNSMYVPNPYIIKHSICLPWCNELLQKPLSSELFFLAILSSL